MKIIYHHRTRGTDAQRVHIREIAQAFRKLGHTVEFVSLVDVEEQRDATEDAQPAGWQRLVRRIPFAYEIVQLGYNAIGLPLLLSRLLRTRADFIYERYSLFNFSGVLAARLLRRPIVLEVNSPFALEQGREGYIQSAGFANWTERIICNAADKVIVVTGTLRRIMIQNGVHPEKLAVMTNGVNLAKFERNGSETLRASLGLNGKVVFGFVGWFKKWHGLEMLVEAFHQAGAHRKQAALLLIGDGPAMEDLRSSVERLRLQDAVIFTGALPHDRVPEYLGLIDAAVQPAANEYCCPMKILEYMAMGKPVIAPRQENIQELLTESVEAVFFKPDDVNDLAAVLSSLLADPGRIRPMGDNARRAITDRGFLWERNAERVLEFVTRGGTA